MKIAIHSDLHMEFGHGFPEGFLSDDSFDVLVIAGDFSNADQFPKHIKELRELVPKKPILFVPGNHDFYGTSLNSGVVLMASECREAGVSFLFRQVEIVNGVRFVACPLWPNMECVNGYADRLDQVIIKRSIADFKWIDDWTVDKVITQADYDHDFIQTILSVEHNGPTVVITHFPPLLTLDAGIFPISPLTNYFYNDYPEFFETTNKPNIWIYGHTHANVHKEINGVRCVSNQLGYRGEHTKYSPNFILEV